MDFYLSKTILCMRCLMLSMTLTLASSAAAAVTPSDPLKADTHALSPRTGSPFFSDVKADYGHFYSLHTLSRLGVSLVGAAVLANTSLDQSIADDIQHHVRSQWTNDFSKAFKWPGADWTFYAGYGGLTLLGLAVKANPNKGILGWGNRSFRAVLVGAPVVLVGQKLIGSNRPLYGAGGSHWHPFQSDHGISGHAFLGAVPFMTAATMVQNPWAKTGLYTLSTLTGLTRLNDNEHYFSQVLLGWSVAWLATHSVADTADDAHKASMTPYAMPGGAGVVVMKPL